MTSAIINSSKTMGTTEETGRVSKALEICTA